MTVFSDQKDTIVALSSPPGVGAIAIIRISGDKAIELTELIFSKKIKDKTSHTSHFGKIIKNKEILDEVLVHVFKAPHTFTGEDIIEINCHGSQFIQQEIISLYIQNGARMAQAGEFSMRAFLNQKMDLTQTEAIADLIHSESEGAHRLAMMQMKGGISNELKALRGELIHFASMIELELDFAEEDVEFADRTALIQLVKGVLTKVNQLKDSFKLGSAIKDGVNVAIVGKPNAGKSSWLNALSNEDIAIVSDIAGTTRDKIEVPLILDGVKFRFIDTAGLRETKDIIEGIGVEKAKDVISKASIVIYMFDLSEIGTEYLDNAIAYVKQLNTQAQILLLGNKSDKIDEKIADYSKEYSHYTNLYLVSAFQKESIELIKKEVVKLFHNNTVASGDIIVTNARHFEALNKASNDLNKVLTGLETGITGDFVAMDIRQVIHHLGSITGEISTDNLLGHIFANFCIGK